MIALLGLPGGGELWIILVIALLLFGKRLPDIARSMGKSISEFKRGLKDVEKDLDRAGKDTPRDDAPKSLAGPKQEGGSDATPSSSAASNENDGGVAKG